MSSSTPSAEPGRYVAEYLDGPLEGTTEHRFLIDGEPEPRLTQVALVDGTEALFDYLAGESRLLNGERYVQFHFDAKDSDVLQGQADPNERSRHI
jgi:hypothetical protein